MKAIAIVIAALLIGGTAAAQGPGMMGPGMMGGHGMMGSGMMGSMGPGMMYGSLWGIELSAEQRTKISEIQQSLAQRHWDLMGKMHQQHFRTNLYRDGKFDEQAARKAFDATNAAHKDMFESWLQAQKQIDALLTPEQRQKLR